MLKLLIIAFTMIITISCTSDHDNYVRHSNEKSEIKVLKKILNSNSTKSAIKKYQPPKNYDKFEYMLQSAIETQQKLNSVDKKSEAYSVLLEFEKEGDKYLADGKLFKAWDKYSMGALAYPSPKILVKEGDALMQHYLKNVKIICNCETLNDFEEGFLVATTIKDFRYQILSKYQLALSLNKLGDLNIEEVQKLNNIQQHKLSDKINCLEQKLNFNDITSDFNRLSICI